MFTKRIIPCLDVNNGRVVKGVNFVDLNDVVIIASQAQYKPFRDMLLEHGATTSREERRWFAPRVASGI